MKKIKIITLLVGIITLAHIEESGAALVTSVDFNSLPSTQGWAFESSGGHASLNESDVMTLSSSVLTSDSLGEGLSGSAHAMYTRYNDLNDTGLITASWRLRILDSEGYVGNYFGFAVTMKVGNEVYGVGFGESIIQTHNYTTVSSLDNSGFHDYRIEATPGNLTYDFYIDDALVASPNVTISTTALNRLSFGDSTGGANAHAEITSFTVSQVPEPATAGLLLASGLVIAVYRRVKKSYDQSA